jgi:Na+-driven multidrug efflux pump
VLNVFLDLFCILVLKWGVAGAAIATIAAQAISGLLCLRYICKRMPLLRFGRQHMVLRISVTRKMIVMGLPMGLQYSITAIGSMVMQSSNNALGSLYVSGFTAGTKIKQFMLGPFDAISTAVSVYCGQNLGAGKKKRIYQGLRDGLILAVGYGIVAGIILILFGRTLSMIFLGASSDEILNISYQYLRCMGYFFWSLGFLNVCRLCTQGLGYSGLAVFGGVAEMIARTSVSLIFVPLYGYSAICYTDQAAWIAACIYIIPVCLLCMKKATSALHE